MELHRFEYIEYQVDGFIIVNHARKRNIESTKTDKQVPALLQKRYQ